MENLLKDIEKDEKVVDVEPVVVDVDIPVGVNGDENKNNNTSASAIPTAKINQGPDIPDDYFDVDENYEHKIQDSCDIAKCVNVKGDIIADCPVNISGQVTGNVITKKSLMLDGRIWGNIEAQEVTATNAKIVGNISTIEKVTIGEKTAIVGDVKGSSIIVTGAIKGNINAGEELILKETAVVLGNIKTKTLSIENGAVIEGSCSFSSGVDLNKYFKGLVKDTGKPDNYSDNSYNANKNYNQGKNNFNMNKKH